MVFVPLQGQPKTGFQPLQELSSRGGPTYDQEKAKALHERQGLEAELKAKAQANREKAGAWMPEWMQDVGRAKDRFVGGVGDALDAAQAETALPILDEINAGARAGGNSVANLFRKGPKVDSQAIFRAQMDADREIRDARRRAHPVASTAGGILGGLATGPGKAVAGTLLEGLPSAARYLAKTGAAIGQGAAVGGAYGLADAAPGERLKGAGEGALIGGTTGGLLEGLAAPIASRAVKAFAPLASAARRKITGNTEATAEELKAARQAVADMAERAGLKTSAHVEERATGTGKKDFAGQGGVGAEFIGNEGESALQDIVRRPGETGEAAAGAMYARQEAMPQQIQGAFEKDLGVSPAAARGDIEEVIRQGEERARGAFSEALDVPEGEIAPGVWSPELHRLSERPAVRDAMESAGISMRNRGYSDTGLTYGDVDVPGTGSLFEGQNGGGLALRPKGVGSKGTGRVVGGTSLLQRLGQLGGLRDNKALGTFGEMIGMDADRWHVGKPYVHKLLNEKHGLDVQDAAERLHDEGYFPERVDQGPPSPREFFDIVKQELGADGRGARFAKDGTPIQRSEGTRGRPAEEADYYGETHPDDLPSPEQYTGGEAPPQREPALMEAPTARAWDNVRRRLNELVDWTPSTPTARVQAGDYKDSAIAMRRALVGDDEGFVGAMPKLGKALEESDYIRTREAFNKFGKGKVYGDSHSFANDWLRLKGADQDGARAGIANDIYEQFGAGRLKPKNFKSPNVRKNLDVAFRDQGGADGFLRKMEAQAKLAKSGAKFDPDTGSQTYKLGQQAAQGGGGVVDMAAIALQAKANPIGALLSVGRKALAVARTQQTPVKVRDEIGRILLMDAKDFGKFLDEIAVTEGTGRLARGQGASALRTAAPFTTAVRPGDDEKE